MVVDVININTLKYKGPVNVVVEVITSKVVGSCLRPV